MARLTPEQIEHLKAQGAQKRATRHAKKLAQLPQVVPSDPIPEGWKKRVLEAGEYFERLFYQEQKPSKERIEQAKLLFMPELTREVRYQAYRRCFHEYETLIFYAWGIPELHEEAYTFWNEVLVPSDAPFSGNSIIRILGYRPKENLFRILSHHKDKFFKEKSFGAIIEMVVLQNLNQPGPLDYHTNQYGRWTEEEKDILERIRQLF